MTARARIVCGLVILLATAGLFSGNLQAQSNPIYFPYLTNDTQTSTEVILTNASGRNANVDLVAYGEDGSLFGEISVPVASRTQVVVGRGSFVRQGQGTFQGWVLGDSDVPGVVGNVRVSAVDGTAAETSDSAVLDSTIVLPYATQSADTSTEIAIVNPNVVNARVTLTLYDASGRVIATDDSVLDPFAMRRGTLVAIFGGDKDYTNASHIIASSEKPNILSQGASIVGFEVVRGLSRIPDDPSLQKIFSRSDWAALAAVPLSTSNNSLTFAQASRGSDWFSLIGLVNPNSAPQAATIRYITESNPAGIAASVFIPGNGSVRVSLVDLFGAGQDSGTIRITNSGTLAGFQAIGTATGNALGMTPGQATAQTEFLFPLVDETAPSFTGLALYNGTATAATIDLYLISPQGVTLGHVARLLLPQQRVSQLVREYFIEGFNQTGGFVFVRSSAALFGAGVIGVPDRILSALSARPTALGFIPAPQTRFVLKGRITDRSTGNPVQGVTVVLSRTGAADVTATTDSNGEYFFRNLVPADYTVKPTQAGFMFVPFNPLIRIDTSSRILDFQREIAPAISGVTVITTDTDAQRTAGNNPDAFAVFGTSEVSIRIDGSNFVGPEPNGTGQTVFFGSRAIPAQNVNFVNSSTIFVQLVLDDVDILAELAAQGNYGKYDISVGGQTPFTDFRSNTRPFYIVPPVPVLVSVAGSNGKPETFARYEVNGTGETITVTGYGFRPGAQILFNGSVALNSIQIDTVFVTSQILRAYLPPQALRFGGNYSIRVRNQSLLPEVSGEAVTFTVLNLLPTITSMDPAALYVGPGAITVYNAAINGINFHAKSADPADPGTTFFVRFMPIPYEPLPNICPPIPDMTPVAATATFVSSNQIILSNWKLPTPKGLDVYLPGIYELMAVNVGPGGGCSPIKTFDYLGGPTSGIPTIDTTVPLSPATHQAGTAGFNLTVFRDLTTSVPFQADAWVNFGTVRLLRLPADVADPDSITIFVPAFLFTSPGTVPITVTNPGTNGNTGGTSNRVYLLIEP
jgi:carboxypeptidase family protein